MKLWEQKNELLGLAEMRHEEVARLCQYALEQPDDPMPTDREIFLSIYKITKRYLPKDERKGYGEIERVEVEMPEEIRMQMLQGRRPVEEDGHGEQSA
jgi:hypothetical protein